MEVCSSASSGCIRCFEVDSKVCQKHFDVKLMLSGIDSSQGPRRVCGAAGDVGSVGERVECGNGRAEEIDGSMDRATGPWNFGSGITIYPFNGQGRGTDQSRRVPAE
jgi:hypothetical protein